MTWLLLTLLASAAGQTVWFAEHDLSEATQLELTRRGCFRGSFGSLSLTTCGSDTATKIGSFPIDLFPCVVQLESAAMLPLARHVLNVASMVPGRAIEMYADETHLVLRNPKHAELSAACDKSLFGALNGTVIPVSTFPIVPQPPPPIHHRAYQRAFNRTGLLAPDPLIDKLVKSYSADDVRNYVQWLATDYEGLSTRITRNSYSTRVGQGGCQNGWRCTFNIQEEVLAEINEVLKDYPGEWTAEPKPFRNDMMGNIVVTLKGAVEPDEVVIIGAHYDSRNTGSGPTATGAAPGADDNGSGSAVLLAIIKNIALHSVQFHYTVILALFCGEEQGLIGSGNMARELQAGGETVIGMFNNDMIGYTNAGGVVLSFMRNYATAWLSQSCKEFSSTYIPALRVGDTTACCSDQQSFFNAGFPAAGIFETPTSGVQYPQYHRSGDTYDNGLINYNQVFQFGQANYACILEYAIPQSPDVLAKRY